MTKAVEYWYRFDSRVWRDYDRIKTVAITLYRFAVVRYTQQGVWLDYGIEKDKFVLINSRKRFACPTLDEAKESFLARKKIQLIILEEQTEDVRRILLEADSLIAKEIWNYDRTSLTDAASLGMMEFGNG